MELNTLPMWSERQVVRLRQTEAASEELLKTLSRYLDNPAPSTALLVEFTGDLTPTKKDIPARLRPLLEKMSVKSCQPRSGREYIVKRLRAEGFAIAPEAITALEEWACGDTGRLVSALDLLCLYRQEEKSISAQDLDALLGTGGTPKEWDLQDAFLAGRKKVFLELLERVGQDPDSVPLMFVGMVSKQLRSMLLLHGHEAGGISRKDISPKNLGFNHPFPAQKLLSVADKWPEPRVRKALGALFELDLALKRDSGPAWSLVERHLLNMMPG
jgi:DNA polymerase-3 subunit delta